MTDNALLPISLWIPPIAIALLAATAFLLWRRRADGEGRTLAAVESLLWGRSGTATARKVASTSPDEAPAIIRVESLSRAYYAIWASAFSEADRGEINRLLEHELPQLKALYHAASALEAVVGPAAREQSQILFERGLAIIEQGVREHLYRQVPVVLDRLLEKRREMETVAKE